MLGLGLVPIQEPRTFSWPGPWIAVLGDGRAAVAFGAPPGLAWAPPGARFEDVVEGYLIAPADVALWAPPAPVRSRRAGSRRSCSRPSPKGRRTSSTGRRPRRPRPEGDRYFDGRGTFSNRTRAGTT